MQGVGELMECARGGRSGQRVAITIAEITWLLVTLIRKRLYPRSEYSSGKPEGGQVTRITHGVGQGKLATCHGQAETETLSRRARTTKVLLWVL
jgi:hypothetical protein